MFKSVRCAVVLGILGVAFLACSAGTGGVGSSEPTTQAKITAPTSGLTITASISSVTLGEECGNAGGGFAPSSDCAPSPPQPATDGGGAGKAAPGGCGGSYCQQSNVQLAFNAGPGNANAKIEIVTVMLVDSATGALVDTLTTSKPQVWNGNGYTSWDQTIKPAGDLKASYDLSAPSWSKAGSSPSYSSYNTKYKLHVTLRIDGVEVTLLSTDLSREPAVAT